MYPVSVDHEIRMNVVLITAPEMDRELIVAI